MSPNSSIESKNEATEDPIICPWPPQETIEMLRTLEALQQRFEPCTSSTGSNFPTAVDCWKGASSDNTSLNVSNAFQQMIAEAFGGNPFLTPDFFAPLIGSNAAVQPANFQPVITTTQGGGGPVLARNSTKTLKCPKCNWHYKYQETMEIHMKEKHSDADVICVYCLEGRPHPKLSRGETYSCGYKPYRCDLCKYSTTTKGNLSIHMQSDKHLHALQEMPQSIPAPLQMMLTGEPTSSNELHFPANIVKQRSEVPHHFQCLICLNFSADTFTEMSEHIDKDRQVPAEGDIVNVHGHFQCLLCPYTTGLKANFQLHTRTDKHIQRVQLINHMREGNISLVGEHTPIGRLGAFKSTIQIRCHPCKEILSCSLSLREHCESHIHSENIAILESDRKQRSCCSDGTILNLSTTDNAQREFGNHLLPDDPLCFVIFQCIHCNFGTEFSGAFQELRHACDVENEIESKSIAFTESWNELNEFWMNTAEAILVEASSSVEALSRAVDIEASAQTSQGEESSQKLSNDQTNTVPEGTAKIESLGEQCPLCTQRHSQLREHLQKEHKIAEEVVDKLLIAVPPLSETPICDQKVENITEPIERISNQKDTRRPPVSAPHASQIESAIFRHRCSECTMAFRSPSQLKIHLLSHTSTLRPMHRCPKCSIDFRSYQALRRHLDNAHSKIDCKDQKGHQCDICGGGERFPDDETLLAHFNSSEHLQKIAQQIVSDKSRDANEQRTYPSTSSDNENLFKNHLLSILARNQLGHFSLSDNSVSLPSSPSSALNTQKHQYTCHVCLQNFGKESALESHLQSAAHNDRVARISELVQVGCVDPSKPIADYPGTESTPYAKTIAEVAGHLGIVKDPKQEKSDQMGKFSTKTQATITANALNGFGNPSAILDLFKNTSPSTDNLDAHQSQQQQNAFTFMTQMLQHAPYFQTLPFAAAANAALMAQFSGLTNSSTGEIESNRLLSSNHQSESPEKQLDPLGSTKFLDAHKTAIDDDNNNSDSSRINLSVPPNPSTINNAATLPSSRLKRPRSESTPSSGGVKAKKPAHNLSTPTEEPHTKPSERDFGFLNNWMQMMAASAGGNLPFLAATMAAMATNNGLGSNGLLSPHGVFSPEQFATAMNSIGGHQNQNIMNSENMEVAQQSIESTGNLNPNSPQKRARTRIADEQLKVLRQYFDINNSPSEEQIKEMAEKAQLPEKVIKHWFRNTLFKERQRTPNSPYNFSIPPQMSIDLAAYQKTGETKIINVKREANKAETDKMQQSGSSSSSISPNDQTLEIIHSNEQKNGSEKLSFLESDEIPSNTTKTSELNKNDGTNEESSNPSSRFSTPSIVSKAEVANDAENTPQASPLPASYLPSSDPSSEFFLNLKKAMAVASSQSLTKQSLSNPFSSLFNSSNGAPTLGIPCSTDISCQNELGMATIMAASGIPFTSMPFPLIPSGVSTPNCLPNRQSTSSPNSNNFSYGVERIPSSSSIHSIPSSNAISSSASTGNGSITLGSGRRANRTRFTDFQLRTLQTFFDKQAYPKDEDVEMLSIKMKLSPRVIVVWFQNARQKARKFYENQPNLMTTTNRGQQSGGSSIESNRLRSANGGVQCKRCGESFSRPFMLIHHQTQLCYKGDVDAQHRDNKFMEENLNEEERINSSSNQNHDRDRNTSIFDSFSGLMNTTNPLNYLFAHNRASNIKPEFSAEKDDQIDSNRSNSFSSTQELLKQLIAQPVTNNDAPISNDILKKQCCPKGFSKLCPLCKTPFYSRENLKEHIEQEHPNVGKFNVDEVSDTDELFQENRIQVSESNANSPLDLSASTAGNSCTNQNNVERVPSATSLSPLAYSCSYSPEDNNDDENTNHDNKEFYVNGISATQSGESSPYANSSPFPMNSLKQAFNTEQLFGTASGSGNFRQNHQHSPGCQSGKRFRTHLTPIQIMKSLFNAYKTPSMSECESLGSKIGLQRRVVQVWFQNARAKERKSTSGDELTTPTSSSSFVNVPTNVNETHCELCKVQFNGRTTLHEHIFTTEHIERIREQASSSLRISTSDEFSTIYTEKLTSNESKVQSRSNTNSSLHSSLSKDFFESIGSSSSLNSDVSSFMQIPYGLIYGSAGNFAQSSPFFYDPNLIGTPIHALKIPKEVMQRISSDLELGKEFTKFAQDGLTLSDLKPKISEADFHNTSAIECEVGWACVQCHNVFQQIDFLKSHQKLICTGNYSIFRLIQINYQCSMCSLKFGVQVCSNCSTNHRKSLKDELCAHFKTSEHLNHQQIEE